MADDPELDDDFPVKVSLKDVEAPVKVQKQLKKALYDRSRLNHHGPASTHMPDFSRNLSHKSKSHTDPYDKDWMSSYVKNPLGESYDSKPKYKTPVGIDTLSCLQRMTNSSKFKNFIQSGDGAKVLNENDLKVNIEEDYLDIDSVSERRDEQE